MFSEVKNALRIDNVSDKIASASKSAKTHVIAATTAAAALARAGRNAQDAEIANHYNSGCKYGLAGSNGSFWSNYYRHSLNNHDVLSLFFADKRNPFNRPRRWFVFFSKLSLSMCLAAAFSLLHQSSSNYYASVPFSVKFWDSFIISLILCPYGYILKHIASCTLCTRANCCIRLTSSLGYCTLFTIALVSCIFLGVGIYIAIQYLETNVFIELFFYSVLLDYASYFYYGVWNWYLLSWNGFLCIPIFPVNGEAGFPGRFFPIYAFWPLKKVLQTFGLCFPTYAEEKKEFQEKFPGRTAIDDPIVVDEASFANSGRSELSEYDKSYRSC